MDDAEFEKQKQRLAELTERWIKPIGLGWYWIDMAYARDDYEPPNNGRGGKDHTLAHCSTDWRYASACITWNMPLVREQNDDHLEHAFVHELMHIFLNEMRWTASNDDDSIDHEERVASTLTKAFLWLRDSLAEPSEQPAIPSEVSTC
jgi:hypothetical protein